MAENAREVKQKFGWKGKFLTGTFFLVFDGHVFFLIFLIFLVAI